MRLDPIIITEPSYEPISVDEVKLASRISGSAEDSLLSLYISAARRNFESELGRTVFDTELEFHPQSWWDPYGMRGPDSWRTPFRLGRGMNSIELPRSTPLTEILSVTLKDSAGNVSVWDPTQYIADTFTEPGRLVLAYQQSWPQFTPDPVDPIAIRYKAGSGYPWWAREDIKVLLLLVVGELYENRESSLVPDRAIQQMLQLPFYQRRMRNLRVPHRYTEI